MDGPTDRIEPMGARHFEALRELAEWCAVSPRPYNRRSASMRYLERNGFAAAEGDGWRIRPAGLRRLNAITHAPALEQTGR